MMVERTADLVNYWEIIADNLSKAGWSWGCVSTVDSRGPRIFVADAHRDHGKRFVVRADEKLTALWGWNRSFEVDTKGRRTYRFAQK